MVLYILVININRARYKEQLDPGNWQLNLDANGLAALKPGAMKPAALPNIFAANPPTFATPLLSNPFAPVINF